MQAYSLLEDSRDELAAWRRGFHARPILDFEKCHTAALISEFLAQFGRKIEREVGKTGVVEMLKIGASARAIGLRADMDALSITENTSVEYRSRNPGRMNACGHDGHTTMLLGISWATSGYARQHEEKESTC